MANGGLSLLSDAPASPLTLTLRGTGVASIHRLSATPTALSFGNVSVGASGTQTITVTNTGNSSVTVSQINLAGAALTVTGLALPVTLSAGQTAGLDVVFTPITVGNQTGTVTIVSTASNSPEIVTTTGVGVPSVAHSVMLSWSPSTSDVVGYNVYRGTQQGGPYTKLNTAPIVEISYSDTTAQAGLTYYYVVTAYDSNELESGYSNESSAVLP